MNFQKDFDENHKKSELQPLFRKQNFRINFNFNFRINFGINSKKVGGGSIWHPAVFPKLCFLEREGEILIFRDF